jgi:hypothetical protein
MANAFDKLVTLARSDPNILALWLDGSRGKGLATAHSDYDCTMIVRAEVLRGYRERFAGKRNDLDCRVMSLEQFRAHAAWDTVERYDRYNFAHLKTLIDKTCDAQRLIDEKGRVPADKVTAFTDASLDHAINQIYRARKCLRDGDASAARLEAAEAIGPILDALFALNERRLKPYYKYLAWELAQHPPARLPWTPAEVPDRIGSLLDAASASILRQMLIDLESFCRANGHGAVFDSWGDALAWMKS